MKWLTSKLIIKFSCTLSRTGFYNQFKNFWVKRTGVQVISRNRGRSREIWTNSPIPDVYRHHPKDLRTELYPKVYLHVPLRETSLESPSLPSFYLIPYTKVYSNRGRTRVRRLLEASSLIWDSNREKRRSPDPKTRRHRYSVTYGWRLLLHHLSPFCNCYRVPVRKSLKSSFCLLVTPYPCDLDHFP